MAQVNAFAVNLMAPSLQADLGAGFGEVQWVIAGYVVPFAAGMVLAGRLGDRLGRRRILFTGTIAFTAASLACAMCPTVEWLIVARIVQGGAAALLIPQVLALVRATFPDAHQRARAVGLYGTVIGLGVAAGIAAGGLLLVLDPGGLGWRSAFWMNLPLGLAILAGGRAIDESREQQPAARLDVVGAGLTAVMLASGLLPLTTISSSTPIGWALAALAVAICAAMALVVQQRRAAARGGDPLWSPQVSFRPARSRLRRHFRGKPSWCESGRLRRRAADGQWISHAGSRQRRRRPQ